MSLEKFGHLSFRQDLEIVGKHAEEWILTHCFYCKNCRACSINSRLQKELKRNSFWDENKHIKVWRIFWVDDLPVLQPN